MNILRSMCVALALYSKLPVPQVEWNKQSMAYALAFFPLVGCVCSAGLLAWCWLADAFALGNILFAAGCTLVPILITGGIHIDGFCDVSDALSSWQTRERRLEILKDSHIGAFALICTGCYLLAYFACWTEIKPTPQAICFAAVVYPLCRTLSGLGIANLRCAKNSGLAATFANNADRRGVTVALSVWLVLLAVLLLDMSIFCGLLGLAVAALNFGWYRLSAYRNFGGINGDLAGWFLQNLELSWLVLIIVLQKMQYLM